VCQKKALRATSSRKRRLPEDEFFADALAACADLAAR